MDDREFDIVIVGGGPAGCAAALTAHAAGLRAAVVGRASAPGNTPGETLHPGVVPILEKLGVADAVVAAGFLRPAGYWLEWDGPRAFKAYGADAHGIWRGIQALRPAFDGILQDAVRQRGIPFFVPVESLGIVCSGDRISGVRTNVGTFRASWILDATGRNRWLARQLRLPVQRDSRPLAALYGYVEIAGAAIEEPSLRIDPDGWTWLARVRSNMVAWVRLPLVLPFPGMSWRPPELGDAPSTQDTKAIDVTWRSVRAPAGPGYFLAGDSAAVLDPVSGRGILKALMTGMTASHFAASVLHGRANDAEAIGMYTKWLLGWHDTDRANLARFYRDAGFDIAQPARRLFPRRSCPTNAVRNL